MSDDLLAKGTLFAGKYRVLGLLGKGGGGAVYRARQENVDREVALKLLASHLAERSIMVERFRREAYNVSQLRHPNTITLFDYGHSDGRYFFVMEMLEGESLGEVLRDEIGIAPMRAAHILEQTLKSLAEAHKRGIVHRDLKPDNIFLCEFEEDRDFVKVLDFGIAKAVEKQEHKLTAHGTVFGTPSYMSPEQAMGAEVGPSTDVYALGLILYEMLTGKIAFDGDTVFAILSKTVNKPVPELPTPLQGSPFENLIHKATQKNADDRYQNAAEFLVALRELVIAPVKTPEPTDLKHAPQQGGERKRIVSPSAEAEIISTERPELEEGGQETIISETVSKIVLTEMGAPQTVMAQRIEGEQKREFEPPFATSVGPMLTYPTTVVGREKVLVSLVRTVQEADEQKESSLVLLTGRPGSGKSVVLEALGRRIEDEGYLVAEGTFDGVTALSAFRNAYQALHDTGVATEIIQRHKHRLLSSAPRLRRFLTAFEERFSTVSTKGLSPPDIQHFFGFLEQIFADVSATTPLVLLLDDGSQLDELSIYCLHHLLNNSPRLSASAFVVVVALCDDPFFGSAESSDALKQIGWQQRRFTSVDLTPLDEDGINELIDTILPVGPRFRRELARLSGGTPNDIIELAQHAMDAELAIWRAGAYELQQEPLRASEEQLEAFRERLAEILPPEPAANLQLRAILQWIALWGPLVSQRFLSVALRNDPRRLDPNMTATMVDLLINLGLVQITQDEERGEFLRLDHPIAEAMLIEQLNFEEMLPEIYKTASRLENQVEHPLQVNPTRMAEFMAKSGQEVKAGLRLWVAGGRAREVAMMERARVRFEAAHDLLDESGVLEQDETLIANMAALAEVNLRIGNLALCRRYAELVLKRTSDVARFKTVYWSTRLVLAMAMRRAGATSQAHLMLRDIAENLPNARLKLEAIGEAALASITCDDTQGLPEKIRALHEGIQSKANDVCGMASLQLAQVAVTVGDTETCLTKLREAITYFEADDDPHYRPVAHALLGSLSLVLRRPDAQEHLEMASELASGVGLHLTHATAETNLARLAFDAGDKDRGEKHLERAWAISETLLNPKLLVDTLACVAELRRAEGRPAEAPAYLEHARKTAADLLLSDESRFYLDAVLARAESN